MRMPTRFGSVRDNVMERAEPCSRRMQKPHGGQNNLRWPARKIEAGDGGFEVRRKNGLLLLGAQPDFRF